MIFYLSIFFFIFNVFGAEAQVQKKEKLNLKADRVDFINKQEGEREINASSNVELDYATYNLCSSYLTINEKQDTIKAKGSILLKEKQGGGLFKTEEITSNRSFTKASLDAFYFERQQIFGNGDGAKKDENIITFKNFTLSSCVNDKNNKKTPTWKMKSKQAKYNTEDESIKLKNIIFYAKDIPVMWMPYYSIKPKATHGFLVPKVASNSQNYNIITPYFITEKTKTHYFLFSPQFFYHKSNDLPTRVNNYRGEYFYKKDSHLLNLDYKIAPNSQTQNEEKGTLESKKQDRYYFFAGYTFDYKNGLFGFNYNKISDRFFRQTYNNKYDNYLTNNIFINHSFENKDSFISLERAEFIPLVKQKDKTNPKLDAYSNYQKYWKKSKKLEFYTNPNLISISRDEGVNQSRFSNSFGFNYELYNNILQTNFNADLRLDVYKKNYDYIQDAVVKEDKYLSRALPSVFIENKIPLYFTSQNKDYLFNITPKVNFKITTDNPNSNKISNQDSSKIFITSNNIFTKDASYGYDFVESGTNVIYGTSLFSLHKDSKTKFEFFVGQKVQTFLTKSEGFNYSSFVPRAKLTFPQLLTLEADLNINTQSKVEYSKYDANLHIWRFDFIFSNLFIDKKLNNSSLDTNTNTYQVNFAIPNTNLSLKTNIVQNLNFMNEEGRIEKRIVESNLGLGLVSDCLNFDIGLKKYAYSNTDLERGYQLYLTLKLVSSN